MNCNLYVLKNTFLYKQIQKDKDQNVVFQLIALNMFNNT